jgi:hypothetical protein
MFKCVSIKMWNYTKRSFTAKVLRETILKSQVKLQVCMGDITMEQVDAIVNAANGSLKHGGGLAAAIVKNGGKLVRFSGLMLWDIGRFKMNRMNILRKMVTYQLVKLV